jgi:hypothetical protein
MAWIAALGPDAGTAPQALRHKTRRDAQIARMIVLLG